MLTKKFVALISPLIALTLVISGPTSQGADLGPSSDYIISITEGSGSKVLTALRGLGLTVDDSFENAIDGYLLAIPELLLGQVKAIEGVRSIEKDQPVSLLAQEIQSPTPSWGLDRIDQRAKVNDVQSAFGFKSAGAGTTIYIGDTGISQHIDLAGRISANGFAGFNDGYGVTDCHGHGTHVATTAAGSQFGVAKRAQVVPIRILSCAGSGAYSIVLAGLDWILSENNPNQKAGSVLNLSIGGSYSPIINEAILKLTNAGITVVAAAGNNSANSCSYSPSSAPTAITVGAINSADAKAGFSNWGSCVDIHAPGVAITGGWIGSPTSTRTIQGTSMASPHVTGAAAVFLGLNPGASVAQVTQSILGQATDNAITGLMPDTVNKLLFISPSDDGSELVKPTIAITTIDNPTSTTVRVKVAANAGSAISTALLEYATDANFVNDKKTINLSDSISPETGTITLDIRLENLSPSTTYFLRALAQSATGAVVTNAMNFKTLTPPVTPPSVTAGVATNITSFSAVLNGFVTANNGLTTTSFVLGTDPTLKSNASTYLAPSVSGSSSSPISFNASFLEGERTYYYKVVAGNSAASVESPIQSFTTLKSLGVAPVAITEKRTSSLIAPQTTVTGSINPMGQTTSVQFLYGSEKSLTVGAKTIKLPDSYTGLETVTVSATMTGLVPGGRMYYRFEAINQSGHTRPDSTYLSVAPVAPVINSTYGFGQTTTTLNLSSSVNAGASNIRVQFIFGTDPLLETSTTTINATPYAVTNASNTTVSAAVIGLNAGTAYYFRTRIQALTGPLAENGGVLYGPITKIETLNGSPVAPVATPTPKPTPVVTPTPTPTSGVLKSQIITFAPQADRYYGGAAESLIATSSSGLPISFSSLTPKVCSIIGTKVQYVTPIADAPESTCSITATQVGNSQFANAAPVTREFKFIKESTKIQLTIPTAITTDGVNFTTKVTSVERPNETAGSPGQKALSITSLTPEICRVSDVAFAWNQSSHTSGIIRAIASGACKIQSSFSGSGYWLPSTSIFETVISDVMSIQPGSNKAQSITFPVISDRTYGPGYLLDAKASSGLGVVYTSLTPNVCGILSLSGGRYSVQSNSGLSVDGAICTVRANQAGDDRYAAAPAIDRTFKWTLAKSIITITNPRATRVTTGQYKLTASLLYQDRALNSGLIGIGRPLVATSTTPVVCTVTNLSLLDLAGGMLNQASIKVTSPGTCTTTWIFNGGGSMAPTTITHSFAVTRI